MWDLPLSIADAIVEAKEKIVNWALGAGVILIVIGITAKLYG
jgi:hypothetical protein